jgi:hypothetical protein
LLRNWPHLAFYSQKGRNSTAVKNEAPSSTMAKPAEGENYYRFLAYAAAHPVANLWDRSKAGLHQKSEM